MPHAAFSGALSNESRGLPVAHFREMSPYTQLISEIQRHILCPGAYPTTQPRMAAVDPLMPWIETFLEARTALPPIRH